VLVPLKPAGSRPLLIWVHPVGGNVLCYAELARHLDPDQPLYALRSPGLAERETRLSSVEAMAARYVEEIQAVRDGGPFHLGGWSMGGIVAFEMARQLREEGEEVSFLTLLDTRAPSPHPQPEDPLDTLAAFAGDLGFRPEELEEAAGVAAGLAPDEALDLLLDRAESSGLLPPRIGRERLRRRFEVFGSNRRARFGYRPRPYGGRVVLFEASESPSAGREWNPWMSGEVRRKSIPGDHYSVLRPPAVGILAHELEACLEEAKRSYPSLRDSTGSTRAALRAGR
jgi:thioesterase domain-containing protein